MSATDKSQPESKRGECSRATWGTIQDPFLFLLWVSLSLLPASLCGSATFFFLWGWMAFSVSLSMWAKHGSLKRCPWSLNLYHFTCPSPIVTYRTIWGLLPSFSQEPIAQPRSKSPIEHWAVGRYSQSGKGCLARSSLSRTLRGEERAATPIAQEVSFWLRAPQNADSIWYLRIRKAEFVLSNHSGDSQQLLLGMSAP